jgi:ectoine hydroxylase-related dioxygenase (phytanoyl-CoA dioxygenase family)
MTDTTAAAGIDGDLDGRYDLPADAAERFDRDGFVRLTGVLSPATLSALEPAITTAVLARNTNTAPMADRTTYQRAFLQVTHLWRDCVEARRLAWSRKLAGIAAELLGVASVRLFHEQALYKEAGGGFTPWHADQYYWPLDSDRAVTVWVPLQATPPEMGPLEFAPGSHRIRLGRDLEISDESEAAVARGLVDARLGTDRAPYGLGDVSYHRGWTFHRAEPNRTDVPRRVLTVVYVDSATRLVQPTNHQHRRTIDSLPGAVVGGELDPVANPVLFP